MRFSLQFFFAALVAVTFAACGGEEAPEAAAPAEADVEVAEVPAAEATPGALSGVVEGDARVLSITPVGNEMKFAQTELTVEAGETVRIVLENTATSPAMQHNVVVLTGDDNEVINRVGQAAMGAASTEYVPEDEAILAYTPLAEPGETVDVTFEAPTEPGTYSFICTFPGHYMMMQGILHVVPATNA